ncbi:MAG TPA: hypothetical protein PKV17_02385, partial [Aquabacterium sp.]|nr:hypothetical protein [Aquabacterium sp.]
MMDAMIQQVSQYWQGLGATQLMMVTLGVLAVSVTAMEGVFLSRHTRDKGETYDWAAFWTTIRINGWRAVA